MITPENYKETLPIIKLYMPDDEELKEYVQLFEDLVCADDLNNSGNEMAILELVEFYKTINEWIDAGVISIPSELKKKQVVQRQNISPAYISSTQKAVIVQPQINNSNELKKVFLNKTANNINGTFPYTSENIKKDRVYVADNRPDYIINEKDRQIIKDMDLPESKLYIFKEVRQVFGKPLTINKLLNFGFNKFCKKIVSQYPNGFRRTEIQSVLNLILMYDKNINVTQTENGNQ